MKENTITTINYTQTVCFNKKSLHGNKIKTNKKNLKIMNCIIEIRTKHMQKYIESEGK